jgi:hypothetical protein
MSSSRKLRTLKRVVFGAVSTVVVLTGLIGLLHTKWGRPILVKMGVGCPTNRATPAEVEAMRQRGLAVVRGAAAAPARPALGFALDVTTRAEALAWTRDRGLSCALVKRGSDAIFCRDVPPDVIAESFGGRPIDELDFLFDPDGKLIQIETMRRHLSSAEAETLSRGILEKLTPVLGEPTEVIGERTASYFDGAMRPASVRYRFRDYVVIVNAMRFEGGVALRERYESATQREAASGPRG